MVGCNNKEDATQDCEQQQQRNVEEEEEEEINRIVRHSRPFTGRFFSFLFLRCSRWSFVQTTRTGGNKKITVRFFFQDQGRP